MNASPAFRQWPACLSALALDRFRLGEEEGAGEVRAHLSGCARCSAALQELSREEALPPLRALEQPAPLRALEQAPRGTLRALLPKRRWQLATAGAGLLAAASLLLVARPGGERSKGSGPGLSMFVQHGGEVRRLGPGEAVAPGDAVRFAVTTPQRAFVAVLSLDPQGHGSVYFPLGPRAEELPAGHEIPLPVATRLDATVGEEQLVGLFCPAPVELEPLRAGLERGRPALPADCQVIRWSFVKR